MTDKPTPRLEEVGDKAESEEKEADEPARWEVEVEWKAAADSGVEEEEEAAVEEEVWEEEEAAAGEEVPKLC